MNIRIVRVDKNLPLPEYKTEGACAFDLYARMTVTLAPKEVAVIPSNFIVEVPKGHVLFVSTRSGTPRKKGILFPNSPGVIDQDYHGPNDEIGMLTYNFTDQPVTIERGERIGQATIVPVAHVEFEEVESIKEESRGGFGSTG